MINGIWYKIFNLHLQRAYPGGLPPRSVILELGPGNSVASAVIGCAHGVKCTYLVDVGSFASKNVAFYQSLASNMRSRGMNIPDLAGAASFEDVLHICNAKYLTDGIQSLGKIPTGSIELKKVLQELKRVLKPGALSSHNIDFQDHLDGALNNLRFSDNLWESTFFAKSGFYTNRIPAITMHRMFETAGFEIRQEGFGKWPALPTPRRSMHANYQMYRDEDLLNRTSHLLLKA